MRSIRQLSSMASKSLRALENYNSCDVCDALLKLKVPHAGFIPDLLPYAPHGPFTSNLAKQAKTIAPASTVLLVPKAGPSPSSASGSGPSIPAESNIPSDKHYVDITEPNTFVVLSQPAGQICAVLGGIMATRMKMRGAAGILVGGRVRDIRELRELEIPIYAQGNSVAATSLEAKAWAIDVPIEVGGITIHPGDIVFADPMDGVVVIPKDKLDEVVEMLPNLTEADGKVIEDVRAGSTVKEAFAKHRGVQ